MKKIMPLAASIMLILVAGMFAGAGTLAQFYDVETASVADIKAGTLNLQVGDNDPCTVHIKIDNIAPGFYEEKRYLLKNDGTLDGQLWLEFSEITNKENGRTEPEKEAGDAHGPFDGELGQYLELGFRPYGHCGQPWTGWISYKQALDNFDSTTGWMRDKPPTVNDVPVILTPGSVFDLEVIFQLDKGTGNSIQSDSVEFDITFHLDQTGGDQSIDSSTP